MGLLVSIIMAPSLASVQPVTLEACVIWILMNVSILHVKMGLRASIIMAPSLACVQPVTLEACAI